MDWLNGLNQDNDPNVNIFFSGLCAMLTYYRFFHPSGPITLFGPPNIPSHTLALSSNDVERSTVESIPTSQIHVPTDRSAVSPTQAGSTESSHMPTDVEKTNSLRSLKHLWSVDRDGSLSRYYDDYFCYYVLLCYAHLIVCLKFFADSEGINTFICSRSDDIPVHGGSPQPDDGFTDRRLLLSSRGSTRRQASSDNIQMPSSTAAEHMKQSNVTALSGHHNSGHSQSSIANQSGTSNQTSRSTLNSQSHQPSTSNLQGWSSQSLHLARSNQSVHSTNTSHSTVSAHSSLSNHSSVASRPTQPVRPVVVEETPSKGTTMSVGADTIDDSKLSWNCTSMMEDTQQSEIIENLSTETEGSGNCGMNKRRGICSSVELGLDKLEENEKGDVSSPSGDVESKLQNIDDSFARLCHKLVANAEVKQLVCIESVKKEMERRLRDVPGREEREEKRESDYIDSKQSAISSDGTPSEVLSAHDYENICAVNIAREAWGLRSWQGYSDIETWLHDDSVVRDRRRDTLASIGTTTTMTSASSERSTESPPLVRQWENSDISAPPLPCRRPRPSYNRMDDYLDTLTFDLAQIEQRNDAPEVINNSQDNVFMAQPYVVDQNGMLYPLPASLDTILEEMEDSSVSAASTVTAADSGSTALGWASSLVATIDEIRMGTSNALDDSGTVSDSDFEVGSYRSLQLDSTIMTNFSSQESSSETCKEQHRFSNSLPSLLQAPRSWSHLTPEEVLFLSELKPQPDSEFNNEFKSSPRTSDCEQAIQKKNGRKPRRKFSILREKFEFKYERETSKENCIDQSKPDQSGNNLKRDIVERGSGSLDKKAFNINGDISVASIKPRTEIKLPAKNHHDSLHIKSKFSSVCQFKEADLEDSSWAAPEEALSIQGQNFFQHVIAQPKFVPQSKKLSLASNASA